MKNAANVTAARASQLGFGAGGLVKFLVIVVLFFVVLGSLGQCAQQLPQLAGDLAGEVGAGAGRAVDDALGDVGASVASPATSLWDRLQRAGGRIADEIKGLWDNTDDDAKVRAFCETMPIDGIDRFCEYFAAPVGAATEMRRERLACLWQAAHSSQGLPGIASELQIQNTCAVHRRDPSGLETCLREQVDPGMGAACLATSPGQFWRSRGMLEPLACPDNVPGVQCDQENAPKAPYKYHAEYLQCLSRWATQYNGNVRAEGCTVFTTSGDAEKWDQCMVEAITRGFPGEAGQNLVRSCENLKPKWWQLAYWL